MLFKKIKKYLTAVLLPMMVQPLLVLVLLYDPVLRVRLPCTFPSSSCILTLTSLSPSLQSASMTCSTGLRACCALVAA